MTIATTKNLAHHPHASGPAATDALVAIQACISGGRGDQSEPVSAPVEDWRSDRDADVAALAEEDRQERQWRWFE